MIKTHDNALLAYGFARKACDLTNHADFITKVDTNGNTLFSYTCMLSGSSSTPGLGVVAEYTDGTIYFTDRSNKLMHYTPSSVVTTTISLPMSGFNSLISLPNGHLLASASTSANSVYVELDTAGNIIQQQSTQSATRKIIPHPATQSYFCLTQSGIERISSNLNVLYKFNYSCSDFTLQNDTIYFTGVDYSQVTPVYGFLDLSLQQLYITGGGSRHTYPTGICINNNKVNIIATARPVLGQIGSIVHYQTTKAGILTAEDDIGILNVKVNNIHPFSGTCSQEWVADADVLVKNTGNTVVNSFYINAYGQCAWCESLLHKKFAVNLMPGDTITVNTGGFYTNNVVVVGTPAAYVANGLWLWTVLPNDRNDGFSQNDSYGTYSNLTGLTASKNLSEPEVFPNPFNKTVDIIGEELIKQLRVQNLSRQTLIDQNVESFKTQLELENLTDGIYFLEIKTDKSTVFWKIIKQ